MPVFRRIPCSAHIAMCFLLLCLPAASDLTHCNMIHLGSSSWSSMFTAVLRPVDKMVGSDQLWVIFAKVADRFVFRCQNRGVKTCKVPHTYFPLDNVAFICIFLFSQLDPKQHIVIMQICHLQQVGVGRLSPGCLQVAETWDRTQYHLSASRPWPLHYPPPICYIL